jgi:hypothetical protein
LAFWFLRAERYERKEGMPFRSVRERVQELQSADPREGAAAKQRPGNGRPPKRSRHSSTTPEPGAI